MLIPVFVRELCRDALKLPLKSVRPGNIIITLQHGRYGVGVFRAQLPQIYTAGIFSCAGIRYVKNIFQLGVIPGCVDDGDALGVTAHIPSNCYKTAQSLHQESRTPLG